MLDTKKKAGNLTFVVEHRTFGDDGGPALRVFGEVDGEAVQLLRFDCFRKNPHYHYAPDEKNEMWNLDQVVVPDTVGWTIERLRERLPEMVAAAGYERLADNIDQSAVAGVIYDIAYAMRHP